MRMERMLPVAILAGALASTPLQGAVVRGGVVLNPAPRQTVPQRTTPAPKPLTAKQLAAQQAADKAAVAAAAAKAAAITAAETKEGDAAKKFNDLVAKLTADFQSSADFVAAQQSVEAASHAYDAAGKTVIAALPQSNPTYKDAATQLAALKAKQAAGRTGGTTMVSEISQSIFDLGNVMGPIEQTAIADDVTCAAAKKKLDDAMAVVTKMMADFNTSLTANTDWVSDKGDLDSAKAALVAARAK